MLFNKDPFLKQAEAARTKQTLKPLEIKQNLYHSIDLGTSTLKPSMKGKRSSRTSTKHI